MEPLRNLGIDPELVAKPPEAHPKRLPVPDGHEDLPVSGQDLVWPGIASGNLFCRKKNIMPRPELFVHRRIKGVFVLSIFSFHRRKAKGMAGGCFPLRAYYTMVRSGEWSNTNASNIAGLMFTCLAN